MNEYLYAIREYIDAFNKIGSRELVIEAEKSYVYNQFDLAQEICLEILRHQEDYLKADRVRALEIAALIHFYHGSAITTKIYEDDRNAYEKLVYLDKNGWEIYDSRLLLGNYYLTCAKYDDAFNSFDLFYTKRKRIDGLKAMSDMYRRDQFDTDTLYSILEQRYLEYYKNLNVDVRDALIKSAKAGEEHFVSFLGDYVYKRLSLPRKGWEKQVYCDDDFVLPFRLREYDCADEIRYYARNSQKPTLLGCIEYLSRTEIALNIERKTINAINLEYREAMIRNEVRNKNRLIEIQERDIENRKEHYEKMRRQSEKCQEEYLSFQERCQRNKEWYQKQTLDQKEEELHIRRDLNWEMGRLASKF